MKFVAAIFVVGLAIAPAAAQNSGQAPAGSEANKPTEAEADARDAAAPAGGAEASKPADTAAEPAADAAAATPKR